MISGTNMIKYTSAKKPKIMHTSKFHRTKKKLLELEKLKHWISYWNQKVIAVTLQTIIALEIKVPSPGNAEG